MQTFLSLASKIPVLVLLGIGVAFVVAGDVFAKLWSFHPDKSLLFWITVVAYGLSSFFYIPTLLREGLVITSILWSLLGFVGFLVVGLIFFKEHLTLIQTIGVGLGIVSLVILSVTIK